MTTKYKVATHLRARDDTSPALKRISRTARLAANSVRQIRGAISGVAKAAAVAAVGAGAYVAAMKRAADAVASRGDEFAKFARQVGISAESLQQLEFVAGRQGASFDNMKSGMIALTKRMGELKAGTGSLKSFLDKSDKAFLKQLQSVKSNEQAMQLLLQKMAGMESEQERMALAAAAFSRGAGADFVRVVDGGTQALATLQAEADKFRPPLDAETLRLSEQYQDAMFNAGQAVKSVGDLIGSALLPHLRDAAQRMAEWIASNREFLSQRIGQVAADLGRKLEGVDFAKMAEGGLEFAAALNDIAGAMISIINNASGAISSIQGFFGGIKKSADDFMFSGAGRGLTNVLDLLGHDVRHIRARQDQHDASMKQAKAVMEIAARTAEQYEKAAGFAGALPRGPRQGPKKNSEKFFRDENNAMARPIPQSSQRFTHAVPVATAESQIRQVSGAANSEIQQAADRAVQAVEATRGNYSDAVSAMSGSVDMNVNVRVEGGKVQSVGTTKKTALVGNVSTNAPGYSGGGGR